MYAVFHQRLRQRREPLVAGHLARYLEEKAKRVLFVGGELERAQADVGELMAAPRE